MERELYMQAWGACRELTSIAVNIAISPGMSKAIFGGVSHMQASHSNLAGRVKSQKLCSMPVIWTQCGILRTSATARHPTGGRSAKSEHSEFQ
jgi:hypothetical protein